MVASFRVLLKEFLFYFFFFIKKNFDVACEEKLGRTFSIRNSNQTDESGGIALSFCARNFFYAKIKEEKSTTSNYQFSYSIPSEFNKLNTSFVHSSFLFVDCSAFCESFPEMDSLFPPRFSSHLYSISSLCFSYLNFLPFSSRSSYFILTLFSFFFPATLFLRKFPPTPPPFIFPLFLCSLFFNFFSFCYSKFILIIKTLLSFYLWFFTVFLFFFFFTITFMRRGIKIFLRKRDSQLRN